MNALGGYTYQSDLQRGAGAGAPVPTTSLPDRALVNDEGVRSCSPRSNSI
jgi:hypothetical protein